MNAPVSEPDTSPTRRSVIVTGAAPGIGRATTLALATRGDHVLPADPDTAGVEETVRRITATGGTALATVGDLAEQRVVDAVVARTVAEFGGIDVLVNNAGIMDRMSAAHETDDAKWNRVLRIDLTAPLLLTRAVLPHMLTAGAGSLVFTGSEAGLRGGAAGAAYTAAKHGITGLVKNLAVMYREQGIRANTIAPGPTTTGMHVDSRPDTQGPSVITKPHRHEHRPHRLGGRTDRPHRLARLRCSHLRQPRRPARGRRLVSRLTRPSRNTHSAPDN